MYTVERFTRVTHFMFSDDELVHRYCKRISGTGWYISLRQDNYLDSLTVYQLSHRGFER